MTMIRPIHPLTPLNEGEPHGRPTSSTPPFSESDAQEQAVIGNQEISNASKLKTRLLTIGMPGNPAKVRLPNNREGSAGLQRYHHPHKAKREYKSATPLLDLWRILWRLCDEEDGQSMVSQNVVAQICSNGRLAGLCVFGGEDTNIQLFHFPLTQCFR
jgi:hypothetical protein